MLKIKLPASTANLGPGFDALGLAVSLYNHFTFETSDDLIITCSEKAYQNENNLVYQAFCHTLKARGKEPFNCKIDISGDIPIARGLGSSSTCIVAGVIAASHLAKLNLTDDEIIEMATEIEGHPDNVVPCFKGAFSAAFSEQGKVYYQRFTPKKPLNLVAFIPDFKLTTKQSREVLPKNVSYQDAVFNFGRLSYLVAALNNGDYSALTKAFDDRVHQPYRIALISGGKALLDALKQAEIAAFISGAGPTIMAMTDKPIDVEAFNDYGFKALPLEIDLVGAEIIENSGVNNDSC